MWWQENNVQTSSREQEGEEVIMVAANSTIAGAGDISAFVGKGVEFKGTISYSGTVKIDGYLDGEIDTDGVLLIGEEAVIQAKVTARTIVCKGKITGDIVAKARVELRAPAVINGSIQTPILFIEDGVLFNGAIEMAHGVCDIPREALLLPIEVMTPPNIKRVNG
jgi:cytoskeletal protein CcmA (bactofilin family)